jgi:hypothetical protein
LAYGSPPDGFEEKLLVFTDKKYVMAIVENVAQMCHRWN